MLAAGSVIIILVIVRRKVRKIYHFPNTDVFVLHIVTRPAKSKFTKPVVNEKKTRSS